MRRLTFLTLLCVAVATMVVSCSSIDCPLNNSVYIRMRLAGDESVLNDTLTLSSPRSVAGVDNDTVLINRQTALDSLKVPMSYNHDQDVYYLELVQDSTSATTIDTLWVSKTNLPHFESVDCSPNMFHDITAVSSTHHSIDSIAVNNNKVTYNDTKPHLIIYFKSNRY
jgi:hypothetical protein